MVEPASVQSVLYLHIVCVNRKRVVKRPLLMDVRKDNCPQFGEVLSTTSKNDLLGGTSHSTGSAFTIKPFAAVTLA